MGDSIFIDDDNSEETVIDNNGPLGLTPEAFQTMQTQNAELTKSNNDLQAALKEATETMTGGINMNVPEGTNAPAPVVPVTPAPPTTTDDAISAFAKDPIGFTKLHASGALDSALTEKLGPLVQQIAPLIQTTQQTVLEGERARIDTKFGVDTFDTLILPKLQENLNSLTQTNPGAVGNRDVVRSLVERIEGQSRTALNEAETKVKKAHEDATTADTARIINALPSGMRPRSTNTDADVLDADGKQYIAEVSRATGERIDEKAFAKLHNTGGTLEDFLRATKPSKANSTGESTNV